MKRVSAVEFKLVIGSRNFFILFKDLDVTRVAETCQINTNLVLTELYPCKTINK